MIKAFPNQLEYDSFIGYFEDARSKDDDQEGDQEEGDKDEMRRAPTHTSGGAAGVNGVQTQRHRVWTNLALAEFLEGRDVFVVVVVANDVVDVVGFRKTRVSVLE